MEEYRGPERRKNPPQTETLALALAMEKLATSVETNMSEERLQTVIAGEQRRDRNRLMAALTGIGVVLLAVGLVGVGQSRANHDQGKRIQHTATDAGVVADYVRACLETPTAQRDTTKCGVQSADSAVKELLTYFNCTALLPRPAPQAKLDACTVSAFQGGK